MTYDKAPRRSQHDDWNSAAFVGAGVLTDIPRPPRAYEDMPRAPRASEDYDDDRRAADEDFLAWPEAEPEPAPVRRRNNVTAESHSDLLAWPHVEVPSVLEHASTPPPPPCAEEDFPEEARRLPYSVRCSESLPR